MISFHILQDNFWRDTRLDLTQVGFEQFVNDNCKGNVLIWMGRPNKPKLDESGLGAIGATHLRWRHALSCKFPRHILYEASSLRDIVFQRMATYHMFQLYNEDAWSKPDFVDDDAYHVSPCNRQRYCAIGSLPTKTILL